MLKQYHAKERGCCLRDMDFLVKKFQLLVPSLCFGALELREGSLVEELYNCSCSVIFLRTLLSFFPTRACDSA